MPELEAALHELGRSVEWPPTPDIASAVRRRLGEQPRRGLFAARRRTLAITLAVLVVGVAAALAVPPARTAILDWLGLRGVKIVRVEKLPAKPLLSHLDLGREVSLAEAKGRAPWLVQPDYKGLGDPDHVYYSTRLPQGEISFLWGSPSRVRLLLTQFRGEAFIEKQLGPGTGVERADVGGHPGLWVAGAPHLFLYRDVEGRVREETARIAANTLVWQLDELTLRLEGRLSKGQAVRIARSVH